MNACIKCIRCLVAATLLAMVLPVRAQAIAVTTPRLPPRSDAPGATQPQPAQAQPGSPQQPQHAPAQPAHGAQQPYAAQPYPTQQSPAQTAAYGAVPAAAAPMVVPQRATAGNCRAQTTPDRQTLMLVSGAEALARAHVPLGEFRAQQVVHSPDGRWAVAYTKLRGAAQFAALTIDLERCEVGRSVELSVAGDDVRFEGDEAVLLLGGKERRIGLRDGRVR
jgi:hypothetical protein